MAQTKWAEFTNELTDPFSGITAVCPKCNKEVAGGYGTIGAGSRRFNCKECGLQYTIAAADVKNVKIGTKLFGEAKGWTKRQPIPPETKAAGPAVVGKVEPEAVEPAPQPGIEKQQADDSNPLITSCLKAAKAKKSTIANNKNPLIEACEKTAAFFKKGEVDHV